MVEVAVGVGVDAELERAANRLMGRVDALARELADLMRDEVPPYRAGSAITQRKLVDSLRENLRGLLAAVASGQDPDTAAAGAAARERARADVPLAALMQAHLVAVRFLWQVFMAECRPRGPMPDAVLIGAGQAVWRVLDRSIQAAIEGYREQQAAQLAERERDRSELVQALLVGRSSETATRWEAADILGIGIHGPYLVVAAALARDGRSGLPGIDTTLAASGIRSGWTLMPTVEVGVVELSAPEQRGVLIAALRAAATGPVGVSAMLDDLRETALGLRLARAALAATVRQRSLVTVFDDDPLLVAALAAPEATGRAADRILAGLDAAPAEEQDLLVQTFLTWLASDGAMARTAQELSCHANTVRRRLQRLERYTGKQLTIPRDLADLCLAIKARTRVAR